MPTTFQLRGYVNENGKLEFEPPADLRPDTEVRIIIEYIDAEDQEIEQGKPDDIIDDTETTTNRT